MTTTTNHLAYTALCPTGDRLNTQRTRARTNLSRVGLAHQDDDDNPRLAAALTKARDTFRTTSIELSRHVGHCDDCHRPAGQTGDMLTWRRAPAHNKPELPPVAELAARLRNGEALAAIATEYDRTIPTLQVRFSAAGFSTITGKPITRSTKRTQAAAPAPRVNESWRDDALCAQTYPDEFFPERGETSARAKKVCDICDVRDQCLDDALANHERFGIRGGLTERERRKHTRRTTTPPTDTQTREAS